MLKIIPSILLCGLLLLISIPVSSSVIEEWVVRRDGSGHSADWASNIIIDDLGNVYVSGFIYQSGNSSDYATIKYNSDGNEEWIAFYQGPVPGVDESYAMTIDDESNIYVTGGSWAGSICRRDIATVKYDSGGSEQWTARFDNGIWDQAYAIAVDLEGNVFVAGESRDSTGANNFITIKYDSSGLEQWALSFANPTNHGGTIHAIAVDSSGCVYVTGNSWGIGTSWDYTTIKYNTDGDELWTAIYDGPFHDVDMPYDIALGSNNCVYVTGESVGIETSDDYATIKYTTDGDEIWVARYDGYVSKSDEALSMTVDGNENLIITGLSYNGTDYDFATVKYSCDGQLIWESRYNDPDMGDDYGIDVISDCDGNVYVTGITDGIAYGEYTTIKYDTSGTEEWLISYNGTGNGRDNARAVDVDDMGNVYVTGLSYGGYTNGDDFVTIKYSQDSEICVEEDYDEVLLSLFPNPISTYANLTLILPELKECNLEVYDLQGRLINSIYSGILEQGAHSFQWQPGDIPNGVYLIRVDLNYDIISSKVLIIN